MTSIKEIPEGFKPIYKGVPPFMKYEKGYGYYGVLLEEESSGKLQCHVCGECVLNLSKHIHHKHKTLNSKTYKVETGLNLTTPLMSESTRKKCKNNFLNLTPEKRAATIKRLKQMNRERHYLKGKRKAVASIEMNNKYGTCPLQVKHQFYEIYNKLGRLPNSTELSGRLRYIIETRFGTYEEALVVWGISREEYREHLSNAKIKAVQVRADNDYFPKYDKEDVKKKYSEFFSLKGRFPTWGEVSQMGLPTRSVFERVFGCCKSELENSFKV